MVIYDQLRISDDGLSIFINAHVANVQGCEDLYISSLTIKTADQVSEMAPEIIEGDNIYRKEDFEDNQKSIELILSINDMLYDKKNFSEDLFFVYIATKGDPGPCIPCRFDEQTTIGVTFDENLLYQKVMEYTKQLRKGCRDACYVPNREFIDFILLWYAFKAAVETEHYIAAKNFYKMLFSGLDSVSLTRKCGCHG